MPGGRARDAAGGLIGGAMTGAAMETGHAVIIRSAGDVEGVTMAIIALAREIGARVAVHAAGRLEHPRHPRKQGRGLARRVRFTSGCAPDERRTPMKSAPTARLTTTATIQRG